MITFVTQTKWKDMNIGMILDNEFTGDMRVENEVFSLSQSGYNVFILCFNHSNKKAIEDFYSAKVIRINLPKYYKNKMKGLSNTSIDLYTMYWSVQIAKFIKDYQIDILHPHDLYMIPPCLKAKAKLKLDIPIIADLHENYPEALKHYQFVKKFPNKYIISIPKWFKKEIEWVNKVDHLITVIEEASNRYNQMGIPRNKISVVPNYVNQDIFMDVELDNDRIAKLVEGRFTLSYAGGFDLHRGLESVIKAIPYIKEEIPNILLILVGTGSNLNDLKQLAKELDVLDYISFEGWQTADVLPSYINYSDICLIPHLKTNHTDNTIPHKLFQYMVLSKPIISSNCNPLERIINDTKSGSIFSSNNEKELAKVVIELHRKPELRITYGDNGKQAVENKYNWSNGSKALIDIYDNYKSKIN